MQFNWSKIKLILLLSILVFIFYKSNLTNNYREINSIKILFADSQSLYISKDSINNILKQTNISTIGETNLKSIEEKINKNKLIFSSNVHVDNKGNLEVSLHQKTPIARFVSNISYLALDGSIIPKSKLYSPRLPILNGIDENNDLYNIHYLTKVIFNDPFLKKNVVEIIFDKKKYLLKFRENNLKIDMGSINKLDKKIKNFKAFYHKANKDDLINKYSKINLQFDGQVVAIK